LHIIANILFLDDKKYGTSARAMSDASFHCYTIFRFYRKTSHGLHLIDTGLFGVRLNEHVYPALGAQTGGQISKANVLAKGGVLLEESKACLKRPPKINKKAGHSPMTLWACGVKKMQSR
jgi:hypothetical protein